ncbi:hypothetical protein GQ54DRAFT_74659 [Martensiomyces pterosporus]|nr:hypothetical protein GQ54DRAFT_74659 [Martensiomyces pterosporus]
MEPRIGIQIPDGFSSVEEYALEVKQIYSKFSYLPTMHIVDFFVTNHWSELPSEWREYFESDGFHVGSLIAMASSGEVPENSPDSLREYVEKMFSLRFPREKVEADKGRSEEDKRRVLKYFLDGMSPKKQAEVVDLSHLIDLVAQSSGSKLVVDVGAGQGYLSRVLAYSENKSRPSVLAVDFAEGQKRGAETYQRRTIKQLRGQKARADGYQWDDANEQRLVHRVLSVSMENTQQLAEVARTAAGGSNWMLCGLHACGDLSSAVLKTFAESRDASAVVLVPCCYNHISESREEGASGFPLSKEFQGIEFGINALKAACQAPSRWGTKAEDTMEAFKRNYFRALLHYLMVSHGQLSTKDKFPAVGGVTTTDLHAAMERERMQFDKYAEELQRQEDSEAPGGTGNNRLAEEDKEFALYVYAALNKLKHTWHPPLRECVDCRRRMGFGFKQMAVVWTLRSLVGPLIEGMLVVDRALYLKAHCGPEGQVEAFALFDPVTSPRNVVLVAQRGYPKEKE